MDNGSQNKTPMYHGPGLVKGLLEPGPRFYVYNAYVFLFKEKKLSDI